MYAGLSFAQIDSAGGFVFEEANDLSKPGMAVLKREMFRGWIGPAVRLIGSGAIQDPVNMIRHDDEGVEADARELRRQEVPSAAAIFPEIRKTGRSLKDPAQIEGAILSADCDEVRAGLGIIVVRQSNRSPIVGGLSGHESGRVCLAPSGDGAR